MTLCSRKWSVSDVTSQMHEVSFYSFLCMLVSENSFTMLLLMHVYVLQTNGSEMSVPEEVFRSCAVLPQNNKLQRTKRPQKHTNRSCLASRARKHIHAAFQCTLFAIGRHSSTAVCAHSFHGRDLSSATPWCGKNRSSCTTAARLSGEFCSCSCPINLSHTTTAAEAVYRPRA
jgi:hypothetical protein